MKKIFLLWTPVVTWAAVLFYLSSIPNLRAVGNNFWDEIIRSGAHFGFYAMGYFLFFRAINFRKKKKNFILPLILTCLYSLSDETHQLFVPTRSFQLRDLAVDFGGALLGWLIVQKKNKNK